MALKCQEMPLGVVDRQVKFAEEPTLTITWLGFDRKMHKPPENNIICTIEQQ